jgi:hypothetical protein
VTLPDIGLSRLLQVLEGLGIQIMIGGSLASSMYGIVRATRDIDMIAEVRPEHIQTLVRELEAEFYADAQQIRDALAAGRAFNLIHYASSYKFDVFPLRTDAYSQEQFRRRVCERTSQFGTEMELPVVSPEDIILAKLSRFRAGGEVSDRQWRDVLGVVKVQGDRLDIAYLGKWSEWLRVTDLLDKALAV